MMKASRREGPVAGVVLAAGSSSRMDRNRLLIEIGGEPLVRRAARRALDGGLSPVITVLGFQAEQAAAAVEGSAVTTVRCAEHGAGMHASLRAGIRQVPAACEAAVLLLADMPLVTSPWRPRWWRVTGAGTSRWSFRSMAGVPAPPTPYARALFPALLNLKEGGGRNVVREHRARRRRWSGRPPCSPISIGTRISLWSAPWRWSKRCPHRS